MLNHKRSIVLFGRIGGRQKNQLYEGTSLKAEEKLQKQTVPSHILLGSR